MTKFFCDRCEKEITQEAHQLSLIKDIDVLSPGGQHDNDWIICGRCLKSLKGWMGEEGGFVAPGE